MKRDKKRPDKYDIESAKQILYCAGHKNNAIKMNHEPLIRMRLLNKIAGKLEKRRYQGGTHE